MLGMSWIMIILLALKRKYIIIIIITNLIVTMIIRFCNLCKISIVNGESTDCSRSRSRCGVMHKWNFHVPVVLISYGFHYRYVCPQNKAVYGMLRAMDGKHAHGYL